MVFAHFLIFISVKIKDKNSIVLKYKIYLKFIF